MCSYTFSLVVLHLDLVVVTTRSKERLRAMKLGTSDAGLMLVNTINEAADALVLELNSAIMKARQDLRTCRGEYKTLDPVVLRL